MKILSIAAFFLASLALAAYPHLQQWFLTGDPAWIADYDELGLYLPIAAKAFWSQQWVMADPLFESFHPIKYPWIQFIPFTWLVKQGFSDPAYVSVLWRLFAGLSLAFSYLLLTRKLMSSLMAALLASALLVFDVGLLEGKLVLKNYVIFFDLLTGSTALLGGPPRIHSAWRIISPGLSLAGLLLFYWSIFKYRDKNSNYSFVIPSLFFAGLFYTYFYHWTAAGLGLLVAMVFDGKYRAFYFKVGCIGTLLGAYEIFKSYQIKASTSPDWLMRSDKFLPIPNFSELIIPKIALLTLAICAYYSWTHRKDLKFLVAQSSAGLFLLNHQIVTGLQIENFHWLYPSGPTLSVLLIIVLADGLRTISERHTFKHFKLMITLMLAVHFAVAFYLRHIEVTRSKDSLYMNAIYKGLRTESIAQVRSLMPAGSLIAGDELVTETLAVHLGLRTFSGYLAILSPSLTDNEWNERLVLNDLLLGFARPQFEAHQRAKLKDHHWGQNARTPGGREKRLEERLAVYDRIAENPTLYIEKYGIQYIVRTPLADSTSTELRVPLGERIYNDKNLQIFQL